MADAKGLFHWSGDFLRKYSVAFLVAFLLCTALLATYWSGLQGQFFFDDHANILVEEGIRLDTFSVEAVRNVLANGTGGPSGRPIARLSYALNYFYNDLDPFAFKLTNLLIHSVAGGLVFLLALRLFMTPGLAKSPRQATVLSLLLAALWLLHPIQVLPVLHVVQRMTSLSAFFLLAGLLCHIRGRDADSVEQILWLAAGWCIFWPLSFFSKETGVLFPLFVLLWEVVVRRYEFGGLDCFARRYSLAMLGGGVLVLVYLLSPFGEWLWAGYNLRNFSLTERLLTEGRVLWFYVGLIFSPRLESFGLFHDDFPVSIGVTQPWSTLPALLGLLGLVWLAWRVRGRHVLATFGIAWFLVGHSLESSFLPLEMVHEHRNYLPLFGALLVVIACLQGVLKEPGPLKTLGASLTLVMLGYFPLVTALRSHQFGDEVRRSQIEAQHHRQSARSQHEAGRILSGLVETGAGGSPAYAMAKVHYELAGQLDPNLKINWLGLIHLNCRAGIPVGNPWVDELQYRLTATPFAPGDRTVLYSLKEMSIDGSLCLDRKDVDRLFGAAIANPGVTPYVRAMLYSWHADYLWLGEHDSAAAQIALEASLELNPGNPSSRLKWAQLLLLNGKVDSARGVLLKLRGERLSVSEKKTLDELLTATAMLGG